MAPEKQEATLTEQRLCILIVTDDPDAAAHAAPCLKEEGQRVHIAASLSAGLRAAQRQPFDMVLFLRKAQTSGEAHILRAARTRNHDVEIIRIKPDEPAITKGALHSAVERFKARSEIRRANRKFQDLFDGVFDGVLTVDVDSETIISANASAANLLGCTQEEIRGMSLWTFIPDDRRDDARTMVTRIVNVGKVVDEAAVLRRNDNEALYCRCNALVTGKPSKRLIQIVFRDVNEKRRFIQYLDEAAQSVPLHEAISPIVHEINNPLAAVSGYAQLSLTTASRKKLDEYLHTIHHQARRCHAIVQKLSTFAQRPPPHRRVTDLNTIIENVVSLFACELRIRNIDLKVSVCPSPIPVLVNPGQIEQVLAALFNNALKAADASDKRRLSISSECVDRKALVTVSDSGLSIAANLLDEVFEPSFGDKAERPGLGLSASRSIVRANDGEIEVVPAPGVGATFRIRFRLAGRAVA